MSEIDKLKRRLYGSAWGSPSKYFHEKYGPTPSASSSAGSGSDYINIDNSNAEYNGNRQTQSQSQRNDGRNDEDDDIMESTSQQQQQQHRYYRHRDQPFDPVATSRDHAPDQSTPLAPSSSSLMTGYIDHEIIFLRREISSLRSHCFKLNKSIQQQECEIDSERTYSDQMSSANDQLIKEVKGLKETLALRDQKISQQEQKLSRFKMKYEKLEQEKSALQLQLFALESTSTQNPSKPSSSSFSSSSSLSVPISSSTLDQYLTAIESLRDEKQKQQHDLQVIKEENVELLRNIERLNRQVELSNVERDGLVSHNRMISDSLSDLHRRYQDSILQLESEKDKFESMKSIFDEQSVSQSQRGLGLESDGDNDLIDRVESIQQFEKVCSNQREEIFQLRQTLQSLQGSLAMNEKKVMLLQAEVEKRDLNTHMQRDQNNEEVHLRVAELTKILTTTQEQLALERRSHETAVNRYIQQISEFEALLSSTRNEFRAKVTEALQNRDAQAAHCETLRAALNELHEREQVNRSAEQARIIENERYISTLKSDAIAKGDRYSSILLTIQKVVKELISNAKYVAEDVEILKGIMPKIQSAVGAFSSPGAPKRVYDDSFRQLGIDEAVIGHAWSSYHSELSKSLLLLTDKVMKVHHLEERFTSELTEVFQKLALEKERADDLSMSHDNSQRQIRDYSLKVNILTDELATWRQLLTECEQARGQERAEASACFITADDRIAELSRQNYVLQSEVSRLMTEVTFHKTAADQKLNASDDAMLNVHRSLATSQEDYRQLSENHLRLQGEIVQLETQFSTAIIAAQKELQQCRETNNNMAAEYQRQEHIVAAQDITIRNYEKQLREMHGLIHAFRREVPEPSIEELSILDPNFDDSKADWQDETLEINSPRSVDPSLALDMLRKSLQTVLPKSQKSADISNIQVRDSFYPPISKDIWTEFSGDEKDGEDRTSAVAASSTSAFLPAKSPPKSIPSINTTCASVLFSGKKREAPKPPSACVQDSAAAHLSVRTLNGLANEGESVSRAQVSTTSSPRSARSQDSLNSLNRSRSAYESPPIPSFTASNGPTPRAHSINASMEKRSTLSRSPTLTSSDCLQQFPIDDDLDDNKDSEKVSVQVEAQVAPSTSKTSGSTVSPLIRNSVPHIILPIQTDLNPDQASFRENVLNSLEPHSARHEAIPAEPYPAIISSVPTHPIQPPFSEQYELGEEMGRGTFGVVYKSLRLASEQIVAVKVVNRAKLTPNEDDGIRNENKILALLNAEVAHPNVIEFFDFFEDTSAYFIVLELVTGGELFDRLVKKIYYSERESRDIAFVILSAIQHCHKHHVVHRDLKPENLLLVGINDDDRIKLIDFGVSEIAEEETLDGFAGSMGYIAPELMAFKNHGKPVDMWAVGTIIYLLLCGFLPFNPKDIAKHRKEVRKGVFTFPEQYFGRVSEEAKDLIRGLLQVNPKNRLTVQQALDHPWFAMAGRALTENALPRSFTQLRIFNARRKFKIMVKVIVAKAKFERRLRAAKEVLIFTPSTSPRSSDTSNMLSDSAEADVKRVPPDRAAITFTDKYSVLEEISKRPNVMICRGLEKGTSKAVAIKFIDRAILTEKEERQLKNEYTISRAVSGNASAHTIMDFYEDPMFYFVVSELPANVDLIDNIVERSYYSERDARSIVLTVLAAVKEMHHKNIVHRNIKPENIIMVSNPDGNVLKLTDFRQATFVSASPLVGICGAVGYAAPEMFTSSEYGLPADMWSIGVLTYLILLGKLPFTGAVTTYLPLAMKAPESLDFPDDAISVLSPEAKDFVRRLLHADPSLRLTVDQASQHPWITMNKDLLRDRLLYAGSSTLRQYHVRRRFKSIVHSILERAHYVKIAQQAVCLEHINATRETSNTVADGNPSSRWSATRKQFFGETPRSRSSTSTESVFGLNRTVTPLSRHQTVSNWR